MRSLSVPAVALTLVAPGGAQDLIGVSWGGTAYRVDSMSGAATVIGSTGIAGHNGMAVDAQGRFWVSERSGPSGAWQYHMSVVDPNTGQGLQVHSNTGLDMRGLAGNGSALVWAILDGSPDQLIVFDTMSGNTTTIGSTGRTSIQALTFHQGVLYAWDLIRGLLTVDTTTGATTDVNPFVGSPPPGSSAVQWMTSHPDGRLLVGRDNLYAVDPTTGVATQLGAIGTFDLRGAEPIGGSITSFGTSCAGPSGPVTLQATGNPNPNGMLTATSGPHAAQSFGILIFGFSNQSYAGLTLPYSVDPMLGTMGCSLQVSVDATAGALTGSPAPASLSFAFPLPPIAANAIFHLQHAVFEPVPGNMSWTNGVRVRVGP